MKVLLPIDGSECAKKILQWVSQTFDKTQTQYYLLHVIPIAGELSVSDYAEKDAIMLLKRSKEQLVKEGCTVIDADYLFGNEVTQICRYAEEMNVDQVVIGSHGRRGFSKLLNGSVGVAVLEHCKRPVIVYRPMENSKPMTGKLVEAQMSLGA